MVVEVAPPNLADWILEGSNIRRLDRRKIKVTKPIFHLEFNAALLAMSAKLTTTAAKRIMASDQTDQTYFLARVRGFGLRRSSGLL